MLISVVTGSKIYISRIIICLNVIVFRSESHHCIEHEKLVMAYHRTVRETLKFKPDIQERVVEIYDEVARKIGKKKKDIYFVGIHNRRTDHIEYTRRKHGQKPLKPSYFQDAMEEMR